MLQQLLKEDEQKQETQSQDDSLLRSLGFPNSPSSNSGEGRGKKRPNDDRDDGGSKRLSDGVSSSGSSTGSKLCEKNKMLASLLAKQPHPHQPIPPVPNSVIMATPQEKMPKVIPDPNVNKQLSTNRMLVQNLQQHQGVHQNSRNARVSIRSSTTTIYLNPQLGSNDNNMQRNQNRQMINQFENNSFATSAQSNVDPTSLWNMQSSDPLLSDILDQVIDIVPDVVMTDSNDILQLLNVIDQPQTNSYPQHDAMSEKMAINIIQKSLMQFETDVNSPSSPNINLPATPPAYPTVTVSISKQLI